METFCYCVMGVWVLAMAYAIVETWRTWAGWGVRPIRKPVKESKPWRCCPHCTWWTAHRRHARFCPRCGTPMRNLLRER